MQVVEVTFMRRRNLGNYEHAESSATVALTEGESSEEAIRVAQKTVAMALTPKVVATPVEAPVKKVEAEIVVEEPEVKAAPKKATKKKVAKKATTKKPAPTQNEVLAALRAYAEAKDSKEMAVQVLHDVTGTKKLAEVDSKDYAKLIKALAV